MNVLALQGSPRQNGNTNLLLDTVLSELRPEQTVAKYHVSTLTVAPCMSCHSCAKQGKCVVHDDMALLYPALATADIVIIASPIYFYAFSAQLKAVIDRCQTYWANPNTRTAERVGVLILTGGARDKAGNGRKTVIDMAKVFFECIGAPLLHTLTAVDTDTLPVAAQPETLTHARNLGRALETRR